MSQTMPSMTAIVKWWREHPQPFLRSHYIGWGEPFCFACGWLPPVPDGRPDSWERATGWLDKAHLHDRVYGGSAESHTLAPLCHLCHEQAPDFYCTAQGLAWVAAHPPCERVFQTWTDYRLWGHSPTRPTTLVRARMNYQDTLRNGGGVTG